MSAETIPADVRALAENALPFGYSAGYHTPRKAWIEAIARAILADRATRPAEPAAPVAEAGEVERRWIGVVPSGLGGPAKLTRLERIAEIWRDQGLSVTEWVPASTLEAERARADAAEQRAAGALARAEKAEGAGADDRRRLDWLEANTSAVISHEGFEDDVWQIHTVSGNRSDLEWTKRAEADTVREAIDAAIRAIPPRASREAQPATDGGDNG